MYNYAIFIFLVVINHFDLIIIPICYRGKCPVRFVWDYEGKDVHVCIIQNGHPLITVPMIKSQDGKHFEALANIFSGRCEFR